MEILLLSITLCILAFCVFAFGITLVTLGLLLVPLVCLLFVLIALLEWKGTGYTRRRFGKIQLPIVTLRENDTGKLVYLIGVMHIAQKKYWDKLQSFVDARPQATVLYEGISRVSEEEKALFGEAEAEIYEGFTQLIGVQKEFGDLIGITYQREGLAYPDSWVRTDLTGSAFIKALAEIPGGVPELFALKKLGLSARQKPFVRWYIEKILGHLPLVSFLGRNRNRKMMSVIIDMRNVVGCDAIIAHRKTADVISVWGGGHLPGMVKILEQNGYEIIDTTWHNAFQNTYTLLDAIADTRKSQNTLVAD